MYTSRTNLEHETVDLGLGQRVGTLLLDGVLGGHHEEGLGELEGLVTDGHLALLHGLEEGGLHLGRRTVDLVGQYEVGEHRALLDLELLALLAVDHSTDKVGGEQVGGKLDTAELSVHTRGQSIDGKGLGQTGNTFEKDVPVGQKADKQILHQMLLSYDHLRHLHREDVHEGALFLNPFV